jgi:hypothetical protein
MATKKGIVPDMEHCFICGSPYVEIHHCIFGTANRRKSEKYKLVVPLCHAHHRGNESPHRNKVIDNQFRRMAQKYFEEHYGTRDDFMKEFGKNYL